MIFHLPMRLQTGVRVALLSLALVFATTLRATIYFAGTYTTAIPNPFDPTQYTMVTFSYTASIAEQVNPHGDIDATATAGTTWVDKDGLGNQSDGRYSDYTDSFRLIIGIQPRPGVVQYVTLATVYFSHGSMLYPFLGPGPGGTPSKTGPGAGPYMSTSPISLPTIGGPIHVATGNELADRPLFTFNGARRWGFGVSYNSSLPPTQTTQGALGLGWSHPFECHIRVDGSNLVLEWDATHANKFSPDPNVSGTYISSELRTQYDVLATQAGGGWLLTRRDQSSLLFASNGRLLEDRDPYGHKLTLAYDGSGRLASVSDPVSSTSLAFTYSSSTGRLVQVTDATSASVSFEYGTVSGGQLLNKIVNQNGKQVTFTYDNNRALLTLTDHNGVVLTSNTFDSYGRATAQDDAVSGNQAFALSYEEIGLPGGNLYAGSDTQQATPMPLPTDSYRMTSFSGMDHQTIAYNYDSSGRLTSATKNGQTTTIGYSAGAVSSIADPSAQATPVDPRIVTSVTDRNGKSFVYTFNPDYQLRSVKDPLNHTTSYTYDAQKNITSVTDPLGRITQFTYDSRGNLLTATDPAGKVTTLTYDSRNNLLTRTDAASNVTTYTYDSANNLLTLTDALNHTVTWTYNSNALPLTMTLPGGGVYQYSYTSGRLTQVTDPNGVVTNFGYDADGRVLYREDAAGKRMTYTYDSLGNLLTVTNPLSQTITFTYDHRNRVITKTDAVGAVTTYAYNNNSKLISATSALGKVTNYTYDGEDRLKTVTTPDPDSTQTGAGRDPLTITYNYDAAGRLKETVSPDGKVSKLEYDSAGQVTAVEDALGRRTLSEYNSRGLLTKVTDPLTQAAQFTYDDLGRILTSKDPLNRITTFEYDPLSRIKKVTDPANLVSEQGFDVDGNRTSQKDPASHSTGLEFDVGGRLTKVTTPGGRQTTYAYNTRGLLSSVTEPSGQALSLTYDDAARLSGTSDPVGAVSLTRDAQGRILTVTEGSKTLTRVYDLLGRLTSFTDGDGNVIGYQYDDIGRLKKLVYPDAKEVSYAYDAAGRLSTVTDWASRVTIYSYDDVGRLVQTLRPNGTKQTRTYDAAGQLTQLKELAADGTTVLYSGDHNYDVAGQLTSETLNPAIAPLVLTAAQTFDADNRLLTHNGAATTFDAYGNLLSIASGVAPTSYTYDARNRLTTAGGITYTYDAEDRRVAMTDTNGTTRYAITPIAFPSSVLVRTAPDGTKTFYVHGHGLLHEETGSAVHYYHHDRRGDTVAITDATGAVTDRISYGLYGEIVSRTGTTNTPFLFNGRWGVQTDANGLYYLRARYYHPSLRRFLNQDTLLGSIGASATLNRFAYANGNPVSLIDPFGRAASDSSPNNGGGPIGPFGPPFGPFTPFPFVGPSGGGPIGPFGPSPFGPSPIGPDGGGSPYTPNGGLNGNAVLVAGTVTTIPGILPSTTGGVSSVGSWLARGGAWVLEAADTAVLGTLGAILMLTPTKGGYDEIRPTFDPATDQLVMPTVWDVNKMAPLPSADGPHTTFKVGPNGEITNYQTWYPQTNPQNPSPWQSGPRLDVIGDPHFNKVTGQDVPTPHVHDSNVPGGVRPANPKEIPRHP